MSKRTCTVHRVHRLLLVLKSDKTKVALLLEQQDLEDLIFALESVGFSGFTDDQTGRCAAMSEDLRQLLKEAFGV
jgi:hypothetical protein